LKGENTVDISSLAALAAADDDAAAADDVAAATAAAAAGSLHSSVALFLHLLPLQLLRRFFLLRLRFVVVAAFDNDVILLRENEFDVTRRGHIGVDSAMGAVGTTPHLGSPIHLNVSDDEMIDIEAFIVGVGLGVLQEREKEFGGLLGPTTLRTGSVPSLGLSVATGTTDVASERDDLLQLADVLEESGGALERHIPDGSGGFARVLVVHAQVGAAGLDGLGGVLRFGGVARHPGDFSFRRLQFI